MKKDAYWRSPKTARATSCEAWWYANKDHIEIHAQPADIPGAHCIIVLTRRQLAQYLERSTAASHLQTKEK